MKALERDLARLTSGEVYTDPISREIYASAACIYRFPAAAVVCPARGEEVAEIIAFAIERGIPITARGAGTSVAGQAVGPGIIIDFRRHLHRILVVNYETREAIVEPGVILGDLNRELSRYHLHFPPDPSSADYATIGGMIANNSSGAHSLKYGDTRAWTRRLKTVLSDGSTAWLEPKPILPLSLSRSGSLENRIYALLPSLLQQHAEVISRCRPKVKKNSSGYHVWDLISAGRLDPVPLIIGSEGTLALVVKAVIGLAPLPEERTAALIFLPDLQGLNEAVAALLELSPSALELMDGRVLAMVREHRPELRLLLPGQNETALLVEFEAETKNAAKEKLEQTRTVVRQLGLRESAALWGREPHEVSLLFAVRQAASPLLYRLPGRRLVRFVEDLVVPVERLGEAAVRFEKIFARHGTEAPLLGHAGSGNLHLNPRLNLEDPADRQRMKAIADELYAAVIEMGGSISGEHGDGLLRAPYLRHQFPALLDLFQKIKEIFDPGHILNPGKILSSGDSLPVEPLRFGPTDPKATNSKPAWKPEPELAEMLLRCHGCGQCRSWCPVVAAAEEEAALPRSKVSVLRAVALGELDPFSAETTAPLLRLLSLCTQCQRCVPGCPTGIEPFRLIRSFLAEFYHRRGRPWRENLFAHSHRLMAAGGRAPRFFNSASEAKTVRALLEYGLKINRQAPLPRALKTRLSNEATEAEKKEENLVVLYAGCLGRFTEEAEVTSAAADILEKLGYQVMMPPLPCCGQPQLSTAHLAGARKEAEQLFSRLRSYAAENIPIITVCPACVLTLRREYPLLLGPEAEGVSSFTFELFSFLEAEKKILSRPARADAAFLPVLFHHGCHAAALDSSEAAVETLVNICGLEIKGRADTCCGLAGFHGLRAENAPLSRALAERLLHLAAESGSEIVVSSCPLCRLQFRSLGLKAVSPILLLRRALAEERE